MSHLFASLPRPVALLVLILIVWAVAPRPTQADTSLVQGKYLSSSGTDLVLSLSIQNPAPANLIVEQYLAHGNTIVDTSPNAKKIDNSKGNVKWLFKNTRKGILTLTIRLEEPLRGNISATVRYRAPQGGTFTELRITP